jgi:Tol biopolymer transport system component
MTIDAGTRLGPYEVVSRIGAGGMGEVFKARDTRLERSVAIKILPREFSHNAQLRVRFEREAKAISQLTHPNICTLHDVGTENGVSYLVMELLEGESLADRLTRGPMPMPEVIRVGAQIADALANAHRRGVIHRDLKPGNIMLTRAGAKLLDFGLAKMGAAVTMSGGSVAVGETEHKPLTEQGTILGTFQYMSPEQLEGDEADPRTDIFALGAVLYEMATGQRAFQGKNKTSLIAAIVSGEPRSLRDLQPLTPPAFEHVVERCLAKDRDERWQSAQDVAEELRWISNAGSAAGVAAPVIHRRQSRERLAWALVAVLALLAAAAGWRATRPAPPRLIQRTTIPLAPGHELNEGNPAIAISPDGTRVVYRAQGSGNELYARPLSSPTWKALGTGNGATNPVFSPDGKWIGFFRTGQLHKIPADGGSAVALAAVANPRGATWSEDDVLYYAPGPSSGIWRVPASGGDAKEITRPDRKKGENSHRWPHALPGGKHLLMTIRTSAISSFDDARIAVLSLADGTWRTVLEGATFARYVPTGHLIFVRGTALYALPFDLKKLQTTGTPVQVIENVWAFSDMGSSQYAFSSRGSLIYVGGGGAPSAPSNRGSTIAAFDAAGVKELGKSPRFLFSPRISPNGRFIAARVSAANDDVAIFDVARKTFTRLTFEEGDEWQPVWSADGRFVYYAWSQDDADHRLVVRAADGSGEPRVLVRDQVPIVPTSASPDGAWIACDVFSSTQGNSDIAAISTKDGSRQVIVKTPFHEFGAQFSPDGKWLAYTSIESGRREVYVRSVQPGGGRWQVSVDGGRDARWTAGGKAIIYNFQRGVFRVSVDSAGDSLVIGTPVRIFEAPRLTDAFDVAPDGTFIGVLESEGTRGATELQYVENWFADLERRVPLP